MVGSSLSVGRSASCSPCVDPSSPSCLRRFVGLPGLGFDAFPVIDGAFDVDSSVLFLLRVNTRLVTGCPLRGSRLDVYGLERPRRGRCIILVSCDGERPRRGRSLIRAFIVVLVRAFFFLLWLVI